jgi:ribosomal protein S7
MLFAYHTRRLVDAANRFIQRQRSRPTEREIDESLMSELAKRLNEDEAHAVRREHYLRLEEARRQADQRLIDAKAARSIT